MLRSVPVFIRSLKKETVGTYAANPARLNHTLASCLSTPGVVELS